MRKLFKFNKEKVKAFCFGTLVAGIVLTSSNIYAAEYEANFSKEYLEWKNAEVLDESTMPRTYTIDTSSDYLKKNTLGTLSSTLYTVENNNILKLDEVGATYKDTRYNLADHYDIRVKNQKSTNECWAFSLLSSMETSNIMRNGTTENFSERHMDYSTAKTFIDGTNANAYNREVGDGGLTSMGLAYLTNGSGAVLETDMPFQDREDKISLSELDKPVNEIVSSYEALPTIYKVLDDNGNVVYVDDMGLPLSNEDIVSIRNYIKSTIINKGALTAVTCGGEREYYEKPDDPLTSKNYFCDNYSIVRDHAITIVGWDDSYSKENFNANHRPTSDGAYIVLNSYGTECFDNGYLYISYEDALIETDLYVVDGTKKPDYDKIYQSDYYGGLFSIGSSNMNVGYYANVFERDSSKQETLESVGVTLDDYAKVEVYVNPNGDSLASGDLLLVGSTGKVVAPGYQNIKVNSTLLQGNKYAIVIKQFSDTNTFSVSIETSFQNSVYSNIKSSNCGYISDNGVDWEKVNELDIPGLEMNNADVCVKGFTKITGDVVEEKFTSPVYRIDLSKIFKIEYNTSKTDFMRNIETNMTYKLLNEEGKDVTSTEEDPIIRTGMKLKLENGKEYTLIVRGDVNCDGNITLTDLSKLILEYNEVTNFRLQGVQLDGADLNCDGKVTLTDISQLIVIYSKI